MIPFDALALTLTVHEVREYANKCSIAVENSPNKSKQITLDAKYQIQIFTFFIGFVAFILQIKNQSALGKVIFQYSLCLIFDTCIRTINVAKSGNFAHMLIKI
jgi:hypothetical protein